MFSCSHVPYPSVPNPISLTLSPYPDIPDPVPILSPQFLLGPHSWVEEVPSPGRCKATRLRGYCAQLQEFRTRLSQLGCQL